LLLAGAVLVGLAKQASDDLERPGSTFDPALQDRLDLYQRLDAACFALGGAAAVAGTVVLALGARRARAASSLSSTWNGHGGLRLGF
jgi:hypothetical protein